MEWFSMAIDVWIALMLTTQSFILWKLLPLIKKMSVNSSLFSNILGGKKKDA